MAHFAKIEHGIVTQVIVAEQDFINSGVVGDPAFWIQTSYNTRGGVHYAPDTNTPDGGIALNMNYAGIGYTWNGIGFAAPQPYPSWTLNQSTYLWESPVPYPTDGNTYAWDESTQSWVAAPTGA